MILFYTQAISVICMDNELFTETIKTLMEVAEQDGIVTKEEKEIIEQVKFDSDVYQLMLNDAYDDDVITEKELENLKKLKELILSRAEVIASLDDIVSEDEQNLLTKLSEVLKHKYTLE